MLTVLAVYLYIEPQLPDVDRLQDVQLQVPLRVYSRDLELIAEFGEQHRTPIRYEDLPEPVIQAILASEDARFFEHPGVDYQGLLRAAVELIRTGEKRQGGSTITMQVARNFFLSAEKTYLRKLTEIFLALKIERELSKQEILELYLNKIYFGHRAYGIGAAAQVYYGVAVDELDLPQIAMIVGLPKAPSTNNPLTNPERALQRRNYVLGRMYSLEFIDAEQYRAALNQTDKAKLHRAAAEIEAPYIAEMVRSFMVEQFGDEAYIGGYSVITTVEGKRQTAANAALRSTLLDYDRRHGYRGVSGHVDLDDQATEQDYARILENSMVVGGLREAIVTAVDGQSMKLHVAGYGPAEMDWEGVSWARPYISANNRGEAPQAADQLFQRGDLIRVESLPDRRWSLAQVPAVSGALASLRPRDGAVQALTGGFDFSQSKFNRAVQAQRQPGSSFKPFIYAAALAKGYTLASIFNDAPVVFDDPSLETAWRPENYSGKFYGPTRMREALTRSRNLVSIRLLRAIGARYAAQYVQRFGFQSERIPKNLSLALGTGTATPLEMARAYSVWANGGFYVEPYFIEEVRDARNNVVLKANPPVACPDCVSSPDALESIAAEPISEVSNQIEQTAVANVPPGMMLPRPDAPPVYAQRVVDAETAYLMNSMMQDVIKRGTGRRAMQLGRTDLAGKTGTTNDQRDAWFCGFNGSVVATVWVGFDSAQPLGNGETGGHAALPMWINYMSTALQGVPEMLPPQPQGLVTVRIDPKTGLRLRSGQGDGLFEIFKSGTVPEEYSDSAASAGNGVSSETAADPLF
ncbi:MAG: penicillin-binding protein 1A [Thiogranum sp.]|nr:penicillin-binding protein 1A [Thiogranum sp.]